MANAPQLPAPSRARSRKRYVVAKVSVRVALRAVVDPTAVIHGPAPACCCNPYPATPVRSSVALGQATRVAIVVRAIVEPTSNAKPDGAAASGPIVSSDRNASTRRPVRVSPVVAASGLPVDRRRALSAAGSAARDGKTEAIRAAVPLTCGAAIDVPLIQAQPSG